MGAGKFVSARPGRPALRPYFCHGRELFLHARLLTHTLSHRSLTLSAQLVSLWKKDQNCADPREKKSVRICQKLVKSSSRISSSRRVEYRIRVRAIVGCPSSTTFGPAVLGVFPCPDNRSTEWEVAEMELKICGFYSIT